MTKRKKKMSKFKKGILIYALILLILGEAFLIYVANSLKEYEKGDINNYFNSLFSDIKRSASIGNVEEYFALSDITSPYEKKSNFNKGYKEIFSNKNISYKNTDKENVYDIYLDNNQIARVTLDGSNKKHRLGLLSYTSWKIESIEAFNEKGLYNLNFYVPSGYNISLNGIDVVKEDLLKEEKISELSDGYDYVDLPKLNHYKVDNLTYMPNIIITDNDNKKVDYTVKDGSYYVNENYYHTDNFDDVKSKLKYDFNPLEFAENWSLFLTADLPGQRYGFYTLSKNLIENTSMYENAWKWATQVDITFTSIHSLDNEKFTNEKISNITVYNENAFSCEVYLEKNMKILGQKEIKKDVLHDIFYFVYYDGAYRVVSMKSVTE